MLLFFRKTLIFSNLFQVRNLSKIELKLPAAEQWGIPA